MPASTTTFRDRAEFFQGLLYTTVLLFLLFLQVNGEYYVCVGLPLCLFTSALCWICSYTHVGPVCYQFGLVSSFHIPLYPLGFGPLNLASLHLNDTLWLIIFVLLHRVNFAFSFMFLRHTPTALSLPIVWITSDFQIQQWTFETNLHVTS